MSIYNALDIPYIRRRAAEPLARLQDFPDGYIVSAGRLDENQKDFTTLINAYAICRSQYGILQKLVLVGGGASQQALENLAAAKGLQEHIYFAGFQSNPYNWMQHAGLFVLSTKYEGLPTVLIEALVLHKPVVATACPTGIREILEDGKAGLLTPPGDAAKLAATIHKLLTDTGLQQQLQRCAATVISRFDIATTMHRLEQEILQQ